MSASDNELVEAFIADFPREVAAKGRRICRLIAEDVGLAVRVKTGWQALTFHHPHAGYVCGLFFTQRDLKLIFEHGAQLQDPEGVLEGKTRQTRHITLVPGKPIAEAVLAHYIAEAIALKS